MSPLCSMRTATAPGIVFLISLRASLGSIPFAWGIRTRTVGRASWGGGESPALRMPITATLAHVDPWDEDAGLGVRAWSRALILSRRSSSPWAVSLLRFACGTRAATARIFVTLSVIELPLSRLSAIRIRSSFYLRYTASSLSSWFPPS